jgi:hypothetical protein
MDKDIIKKEEAQSGEIIPYRDPALLAEFMRQPQLKIAELVTGVISRGWSGLAVAGGRIIQGAIQGKMMQQVGKEIKKLVEDGKIKEDYARSKYGFKTLAELLNFIDSEEPDEDRFEAVKDVFYYINSNDALPAEELLNYQIFQIIKKLTSSQIVLLKLSYDFYLNYKDDGVYPFSNHGEWIEKMMEKLKYNIGELVENDEIFLIDKALLNKKLYEDGSGIQSRNARLTGLGIKLCEYITIGEAFVGVKNK